MPGPSSPANMASVQMSRPRSKRCRQPRTGRSPSSAQPMAALWPAQFLAPDLAKAPLRLLGRRGQIRIVGRIYAFLKRIVKSQPGARFHEYVDLLGAGIPEHPAMFEGLLGQCHLLGRLFGASQARVRLLPRVQKEHRLWIAGYRCTHRRCRHGHWSTRGWYGCRPGNRWRIVSRDPSGSRALACRGPDRGAPGRSARRRHSQVKTQLGGWLPGGSPAPMSRQDCPPSDD